MENYIFTGKSFLKDSFCINIIYLNNYLIIIINYNLLI